jgi:hypothetical protein
LQINWVFLTEKNIVVILCDSCEVRTESRFHFVVLLSTLLDAILHPSHHLLNVLLQIATKLGLSNKKNNNLPALEVTIQLSLASSAHLHDVYDITK